MSTRLDQNESHFHQLPNTLPNAVKNTLKTLLQVNLPQTISILVPVATKGPILAYTTECLHKC